MQYAHATPRINKPQQFYSLTAKIRIVPSPLSYYRSLGTNVFLFLVSEVLNQNKNSSTIERYGMQAKTNILPILGLWLVAHFLVTTLRNTIAPTGSLTQQVLRLSTTMKSSQTRSQTESEPTETTSVVGGEQHAAVSRYNGPNPNEMDPKQKEIHDYILQSRPGTGLSGPFGPWLAVPEIAGPASQLGKACRYDTSLSFRESELVILLTGAKARSSTEFAIHTGEALKAGISKEVIESIPRDDEFSLEAVREKLLPLLLSDDDNDREKAIVTFAAELLHTSTVSEETYQTTKAALDNKDSVLVEITSIVGYYMYVSYTLNVFRIPAK